MLKNGEQISQLGELRFRGWRGGRISIHRAFTHHHFGRKELVGTSAAVITISLLWMFSLPDVGEMWFRIFRFWHAALGLEGSVARAPQVWGPIHFSIPTVLITAGPPSAFTWWLTAVVTVAATWVSFGFSEEHLPWTYFLRFLAIVQTTSLIYFAFDAAKFPHDLPSYIVGMLHFGAIFLSLLPFIFGFTYFIFDFSLTKKIAITTATMAYVAILMPFQYMLHAYLIHCSVLFMPVLYFAFGPFLDVLVFVSLYAWGMSWQSQPASKIG